jgi:septin family protein
MDNIAKQDIDNKIKALEEEFMEFSKTSQQELDQRNQSIQAANRELQARLKLLQQELDKRAGAIEALKSLTIEDKPKKNGKPKLEVVK